jgi:hypothetical protein
MAIILLSSFSVFAFAEGSENTYRDDSLGISFTIPDGWTRYEDFTSDSIKYIFVKDSSEAGTYFVYSVFDLYAANIEGTGNSEISRQDINNSSMTVEEFKKLMSDELKEEDGITNLTVEAAKVANNSFFKLNFNQDDGSGEIETVVVYCHLYDGYATYYRYETYEPVLDEEDAQSIVSTVVFENEKGSNKTQTDFEKTVKNAGKGIGQRVLVRFLIGAGAVLVSAIGGIGIRRKNKKKGVPVANDPNFNYIPQNLNSAQDVPNSQNQGSEQAAEQNQDNNNIPYPNTQDTDNPNNQ